MISIPLPDKFGSRKEWEAYVWREITKKLAGLSSAKEIEKFLAALLTDHERREMVRRAGAADFLRRGKTYREVGDIFWLSPSTISAIRKSMREGGYISRHTRNKKKNNK